MTAGVSPRSGAARYIGPRAPAFGALLGLLGALAVQGVPAADALRVCAAQEAKPYSMADGSGFENRLARLLAERMNLPLQFVWSKRPAIYLEMDLMKPGKCDVIMGVDPGDPRMLTTQPYYRSGYAFITRADSALDISAWDSPDLLRAKVILIVPGSPPEHVLRRLNRYDDNINHIYSLVNFQDRRNQYTQFDPERMINEVAQGNADLAILWAPEVARYVKKSTVPLKMELSTASAAGPTGPVTLHYDQAIGVSSTTPELVDRLNTALKESQRDIEALLREEGVPLLHAPVASPADGRSLRTQQEGRS